MADVRDERDEGVGAPEQLRVLLYSDHPQVRDAVTTGVGIRVAADLPPLEWVQVATRDAVISAVEGGGIDLLVLDGEAGRSGGMGLCRQLKDEVDRCPPVLILIGRADDAWLASWSEADAVVVRPLDPVLLGETVLRLLRSRAAA
jgi:DNA-binding response OmpR family regulator